MSFLTRLFRRRMDEQSDGVDAWARHLAQRVYHQHSRRRTIEVHIEGHGVVPITFPHYHGPDTILVDRHGELVKGQWCPAQRR